MNFPVIITHQGEAIAVVYNLSGTEQAVQEHFVEPDIYLVGVGFMKAVFSNGLECDLEEITIYPYDDKVVELTGNPFDSLPLVKIIK